MKRQIYLLLVLLLAALFTILLSCSNSTGPDNSHAFPAAIDSVAENVTLLVYADPWHIAAAKSNLTTDISAPVVRIILDTLYLKTENTITLDYQDYDYYFIYARKQGFYTELYKCGKGEPIDIDLDAVPDVPNSVTGVIFEQSDFLTDCYFGSHDIALTFEGGSTISGKTDSLGRYGFSHLDESNYTLYFNAYDDIFSFPIINTSATDYDDLAFSAESMVDAPNIYLYPESTMDIDVTVDFPGGGRIVNSEPPYNNGWTVNVTPEGLIDGQYNYLFYETRQTIDFNTQSGWLLDGTDLESELRFIMMNLGYMGREVDDFIGYWLPRFGTPNYLALYPQDVESMITLTITPQPDNLMRTIFLFLPLDSPIELEEPPLPDVVPRDGFTAVEWGGILIQNQDDSDL